MKNINRAVIEEYSKSLDLTIFQNAYNLICQHIQDTLNVIKQRNHYITEYNIYVANEAFTGQEHFATTLDLFIVFNAVQIEVNYNNKPKNKLKKHLKDFWRLFKNNFIIFGSKKKKKARQQKELERQVVSLKDYDVETLYYDLTMNLTKVLFNKSAIKIFDNKITVVGEDEFGVEINIYPVFYVSDETFKLYNISSQKHLLINFHERFNNITVKNLSTKDKFSEQIRIFNNLYWNFVKQNPNQIFIESLLFSCPNELYVDNKIDCTLNLVNYLKNTSLQKLVSICNENIKLFDEPLNKTSLEKAIKFISSLQID